MVYMKLVLLDSGIMIEQSQRLKYVEFEFPSELGHAVAACMYRQAKKTCILSSILS